MKNLKEKKGFTLIELLAVIVVLSIVMVIGATTVLPYMSNAPKEGFATDSGYAVEAATNAMRLINLGSISGETLIDAGNYKKTDIIESEKKVGETYCFTLKKLVELGLWDKGEEVTGENPTYKGTVTVTVRNDSKAYTYHLEMENDKLYVQKDGTSFSADDVNEYTETSGVVTICS